MRLIRPVVLVLTGLLLAACSLGAPPGEELAFESASPAFIDELLAGSDMPTVTVSGRLMTPASPPPWPAVVMLHSASGQGAIDWAYAELLTGEGYAVFAVDSFSARGAFRTVDDQTLVSEAAMVLDAYRALDLLAADPRIAEDRVALLGFSKGGIAAFYASYARVRAAAHGRRFAAHAAHYPWCGLRLAGPVTTGVPVLVQIGGRDDITPAGPCRDRIAEMRAAAPDAAIELVVYPEARHAFDHPALASLGWVPITGMIPGDCLIEEHDDGTFVEVGSGRAVTGGNLKTVLEDCGRRGSEAGGDPEAAALARVRLVDFLAAALGG